MGNNLLMKKIERETDNYDELIFSNESIESAEIPSNIKTIDLYYLYQRNQLQKIVLYLNKAILIDTCNNSFSYSSIKSITIPSSVEYIGKHTFRGCENLVNVEFSENSNLHTIGIGVFSYT